MVAPVVSIAPPVPCKATLPTKEDSLIRNSPPAKVTGIAPPKSLAVLPTSNTPALTLTLLMLFCLKASAI